MGRDTNSPRSWSQRGGYREVHKTKSVFGVQRGGQQRPTVAEGPEGGTVTPSSGRDATSTSSPGAREEDRYHHCETQGTAAWPTQARRDSKAFRLHYEKSCEVLLRISSVDCTSASCREHNCQPLDCAPRSGGFGIQGISAPSCLCAHRA
jgi:hypothetical protein